MATKFPDSKQDLLNAVIDAITASGKKFSDIKKESILSFFAKENIPKASWNNLYDTLKSMYQPDQQKQSPSVVVDYSNTSHNDVKVRQPRKSVFSDIKKIAG